jgi:hypothetical protein
MIRYSLSILLGLIASSCSLPVKEDDSLLQTLMQKDPSKFQYILEYADSLEVQIMYTQINRDANNNPSFKSFYFNVDSTRYFYPASTVKLPLVLLSLEKLNELNIQGLTKFTPMYHDSVYAGQRSVKSDPTSENGQPSVAHYAMKILVNSDNDAYNCLYEFIGQRAANEKLRSKGYNMRVLHRLERPLPPDQNRHTEAVRFVQDGMVIFQQPMLVNPDSIKPTRLVFKGRGYLRNDTLVRKPLEFTYKNFYPLQEQQEVLKAIIFPESVKPEKRFNISPEDREFVLQYMSQLPRETKYPPYEKDTSLYDAYRKFLMFGEDRMPIPSNIRIFNKEGDAYGYMIDNAYIVDFDAGVEFMLSAVISTNSDGIFGDDLYDYKTVGYPFMKNLGQLVYHYELNRKRARSPDLGEFKFPYDQ